MLAKGLFDPPQDPVNKSKTRPVKKKLSKFDMSSNGTTSPTSKNAQSARLTQQMMDKLGIYEYDVTMPESSYVKAKPTHYKPKNNVRQVVDMAGIPSF